MNRLKKELKCELARREFWEYCKLKASDFYKESREYLVEMCNDLQEFTENDDDILIINLPPRHGKSRTAGLLVQWLMGKDNTNKIMTASYNETLSTVFSKQVRDSISENKADENILVYSDIFENTKIKRGDAAAKMWSLEGQSCNNYLATSPGGTATGFGADYIIIDDLIKSAYEANNQTILENHWDWFCFAGNTKINTRNGYEEIQNIRIGDKILTYNHSKCIIEEKPVVRVDSKKSSIYRLEFENGREIETTGNHKFYTNRGYKTVEEILLIMWGTLKEGENVLFSNVQKQGKREEITEREMFELSKGNTYGKKEQTEEVLFYGMQNSIQRKKLKIEICDVGQNKKRSKRKIQKMSKMWRNKKSTCSSYRPQYKKQRFRQSDGSLPIVPYKLSQATRISSNDIRTVYDIEVAENHNFFANDMLVHNCNTMMSRLQGKRKIIIIMTRWSTNDLAGKAMDYFSDIGLKVKTVAMKAFDGEKMLCDEVLTKRQYNILMETLGEDIASANYNQVPLNLKGALYTTFLTYTELPEFEGIYNYTDTADMGDDYLCSITAGLYKGKAYILDVYYTQDGMETTEPELARRLADHKVNYCYIESNNGGRGFGRNVEKETRSLGSKTTNFNLFTQSKNKNARILTAATTVMNCIVYPEHWKQLFKEFYNDTINYQRIAKNLHDDNADSLTGLTEKMPIGNTNNWGW